MHPKGALNIDNTSLIMMPVGDHQPAAENAAPIYRKFRQIRFVPHFQTKKTHLNKPYLQDVKLFQQNYKQTPTVIL